LRPYLEETHQKKKKTGGVAQEVDPEFKLPQDSQKKKITAPDSDVSKMLD
jgi:hypothetical protein